MIYINFMYKYLVLLVTVGIVCSIHTHEEESHEIMKTVDPYCCSALGGVVCGTTFHECCQGGCRQSLVGGTTCLGQKIPVSAKTCPNSCKNICHSQGGIICGSSLTTEECCQPAYCRGFFTRSCVPGTRLNLGMCMKNTAFANWRV